MTDADDINEAPGQDVEPEHSGSRAWRARKPIRSLRREVSAPHKVWADWDTRENERSRLPESEQVHFAGVVLIEVFPPSRVAALRSALMDFPAERKKMDEWAELLSKGRSVAGHGGWVNLGCVRRPGEFVLGEGPGDPDVPEGVDAIWAYLMFLTPSLTVVVATFTFADEAGDLSGLLRADYHAEATDVQIRAHGKLGLIRARIPWARPARHGWSFSLRRAGDQKHLACMGRMTEHETACSAWLAARFPGRFSIEAFADRPKIRILLTKEDIPFADRRPWLAPVGLGFASDVWRSSEDKGWALSFYSWPRRERFTATAAARRRDVADTSPGKPTEDADSSWYLTQEFADVQSSLVARWAVSCLLSVYADRLADFRDQTSRSQRWSRPVARARELDRYLIGDGLDAATVVSDVMLVTENLARFRFDVPEYCEDVSGYPSGSARSQEPGDLVQLLRDGLRVSAQQLERDTAVTTANVRASAELRQAVANTRLQRSILVLTTLAVLIAVVSLIVSLHGHGS